MAKIERLNSDKLPPRELRKSSFKGVNMEGGSLYFLIKQAVGDIPVYTFAVAGDNLFDTESQKHLHKEEIEEKIRRGDMIVEEAIGFDLPKYGANLKSLLEKVRAFHHDAKKIAVHFHRGPYATKRLFEQVILPIFPNPEESVPKPHSKNHYSYHSDVFTFLGGWRPDSTHIYDQYEFDVVVCIGIFRGLRESVVPGRIYAINYWKRVNLENSVVYKCLFPVGNLHEKTLERQLVGRVNMITIGGTLNEFYNPSMFMISEKTCFKLPPFQFSHEDAEEEDDPSTKPNPGRIVRRIEEEVD
jgi:hypothetical protein